MLNIPMLIKHVTLEQARIANDVYRQCVQAGASHEAAIGAIWRQAYNNGVTEERIHAKDHRLKWLEKNKMLTALAAEDAVEEVTKDE